MRPNPKKTLTKFLKIFMSNRKNTLKLKPYDEERVSNSIFAIYTYCSFQIMYISSFSSVGADREAETLNYLQKFKEKLSEKRSVVAEAPFEEKSNEEPSDIDNSSWYTRDGLVVLVSWGG